MDYKEARSYIELEIAKGCECDNCKAYTLAINAISVVENMPDEKELFALMKNTMPLSYWQNGTADKLCTDMKKVASAISHRLGGKQ